MSEGDVGPEPGSAVEAYRLGILMRESGDDAAAEAMLRRAMDWGDPVVAPAAAASLGFVLLLRDDIDGALTVYQAALDSDDPEAAANAAFNIAVIHDKRGNAVAAREAYQWAIESRHPHWGSGAAVRLGLLLERSGDTAGAWDCMEQAVALGAVAGEPAALDAAEALDALGRVEPVTAPADLLPLVQAAKAEERRFAEDGDAAALDHAIEGWREIIRDERYTRAPVEFRAAAPAGLAHLLHLRFGVEPRRADIDEAIALATQAVALTPEQAPHLAQRYNTQGAALIARYQADHDAGDLDDAVDAFERATAVVSVANRPEFLANLAEALRLRHDQSGHAADLDGWIAAGTRAVTRPDRPSWPNNMLALADGLVTRFHVRNNPEDLEAAIDVYRQALAAPAIGGTRLAPLFLAGLAGCLTDRFERGRHPDDLDDAIDASTEAATRLAGEDQGVDLYASQVGLVGSLYRRRYAMTGLVADLDRAIECDDRAAEFADDDADHYLDELAHALSDRAEATGDVEDLRRAIAVRTRTVEAATGAIRSDRLSDLGSSWLALYDRTGELDALTRSVEAHEDAVRATGPDAPGGCASLVNLGAVLVQRYHRSGATADLERAIDSFEQAASLDPPNPDQQAAVQNNLGTGLLARHRAGGDPSDLERAVSAFRTAVHLEPPPSPEAPSRLSNLGAALNDRFRSHGDLHDLDEAIRSFAEAVAATPDQSVELPMHLNNLANGLERRFALTADAADRTRAEAERERAVRLTPEGAPELPMYLANLGRMLADQFAMGTGGDLDRAVTMLVRAVELSTPTSPLHPSRLGNLASALTLRGAADADGDDLTRAVALQREALEATPPQAPERANRQAELGVSLSARYLFTHEDSDAGQADEAFRAGCAQAIEVEPATALATARSWGRAAAQRHAWVPATEAYTVAMRALAILFERQAWRREKETWLGWAPDVAAEAAFTLVNSGDLRGAAVALERGRALILSEAIARERAALQRLDDLGHETLRRRYEQAARQIAVLEAQRSGL